MGKTLIQFQDVFAKNDTDLGCFTAIKHKIDTGSAKPIKQRLCHTPIGFEGEEEKHLKMMLKCGVIQLSSSEWASPSVLVCKKDGGLHWCIDYQLLNDVTVKDAYPLPLIEDCLDTLSGCEFFSSLDMASGYWQIVMEESDQSKTAFLTKYGLYKFVHMPFGLCNAPATFQRAMQLVFRGMTWQEILSYLDDLMVVGAGFKGHLRNLCRSLM